MGHLIFLLYLVSSALSSLSVFTLLLLYLKISIWNFNKMKEKKDAKIHIVRGDTSILFSNYILFY